MVRQRGGDAVKALEQLDEQAPSSRAANLPTPRITLRIVHEQAPQPIDITPRPPQVIDGT
jgi:hypothetical protein